MSAATVSRPCSCRSPALTYNHDVSLGHAYIPTEGQRSYPLSMGLHCYRLSGHVHAGCQGDTNASISALELRGAHLVIAQVKSLAAARVRGS